MKHKYLTLVPAVLVVVIIAFGTYFTVTIFKEGKASQVPRFEVGAHEGAEFCAECHEEIYDQWSKTSSHSISTTLETYAERRLR
jgi:hypothetical protein